MVRLFVSLVVVFASLFVSPAAAQTVCGERRDFVRHLARGYQEHPVAIGLVSNGALLEVLASPNGSWTILVTRPGGWTCVVAAGESWEMLPKPVSGEDG